MGGTTKSQERTTTTTPTTSTIPTTATTEHNSPATTGQCKPSSEKAPKFLF